MNPLLLQTRRHFFQECGVGVGAMALASLLGRDAPVQAGNPLAPRATHFPARATSVIYLFMAGGPSQLELFDYKPELQRLSGQPIPQSFLEGRRFAFMDSFTRQVPRLLGIPLTVTVASHLEFMIFGALIVFFLIVEPHGLARLWSTGKEKLRLWPFPH